MAEPTSQAFAVVELYTSEGCSSCPPADQFLKLITENARKNNQRIFTMAFHVDYWNYLGWKDSFSHIRYSLRQKNYVRALNLKSMFTPQMVVNGKYSVGGNRRASVQKYIDQSLSVIPNTHLRLNIQDTNTKHIKVHYELNNIPPNSMLITALVERGIDIDIKGGENRGEILTHTNVVRTYDRVPLTTKRGEFSLTIPQGCKLGNSSIISFVQNPETMEISAAESLDLKI